METDKEVKVETLSEGEAWQIFYSKVGETAMWPIINPIAKEIVKECGGLPLALNVVGVALRKVEDVAVWQNRLKKLRAPFISLAKHPSDRVFESLKVSYEELHDTNIQNCFLYCGLYPEGHRIIKSELIAYWRAEGILPSSGRGTLKDALNEGLEVLHDLIDASLLDKCKDEDDDKHVKMHDVIRDLVLKMTSSGGETRQIVRAGLLTEEETIVEDKEWEEATRISFMCTKYAPKLPEMPNCPKLSSLLLRSIGGIWHRRDEIVLLRELRWESRPGLYEIPKSFFNIMPNLRVLDLSYTFISSLPCSISNLVNLRALFLQCCRYLEALPHEINLLKSLEVLCVQRSGMEAMPAEMFELSSLKVLQFSFVRRFRLRKVMFGQVIFPTNAKEISQLSELEEVSVMNDQHVKSHQSVEVIAKELGRLPRLSSLEFNFGTVNNLLHFLHSSSSWRDNKLTEFLFFVGIGVAVAVDLLNDHDYLKERRKRCLICGGRGGDGSGSTSTGSILPSAIKEVLSRSRFFFLCKHGEVKKPFFDLGGVKTTSGLRYCSFEDCDGLENFLDEDGLRAGAFANLEFLKLCGLGNLWSICECYQSPVKQLRADNSLASLGQLEIRRCHKLKNVLPRRLVPLLLALESLKICSCRGIEEVFSCEEEDDDDDDQYELPKLKILEFRRLPELVGCSKLGKASLHCPMLKKISVRRCPKLKESPFGFSGAPNLKINRKFLL